MSDASRTMPPERCSCPRQGFRPCPRCRSSWTAGHYVYDGFQLPELFRAYVKKSCRAHYGTRSSGNPAASACFTGSQTEIAQDEHGAGTAPRHCLASGPTDRAYQKRTKYRQIYRYLPLLTLSNLFIVNSRWVDGDRVKMALYR